MTLNERANKLKAEALALDSCFGLSDDAVKPVKDAMASYDKLWNFDGYVNPDELHAALDKVNDAIEDVSIAHKITEEQLEQLAKELCR